jgi:hypothetical protein
MAKKKPEDKVLGDTPPKIFFTKGDIAWIERDTREQFNDKDRVEENIRKMEKNNEKELSEASDNV